MLKSLLSFIRITLIGGILFLLPLAVLLLILSKAYGFLSGFIQGSPIADFAGPIARAIITVLILMVICFLAGLLMRTKRVRKMVTWAEDKILVFIPGYTFIKTLSSSQLTKDEKAQWKPATVFIDDNEVICFVIDETEHYCSIFLPSAPAPSSGTVCVREKEKVTYLDINMKEAFLLIKQFGRGAAQEIEKVKIPSIQT